jgi:sulfate permease, SulP family
VLSGFLTGVAVNIVLSQVSDISGFSSGHSNRVVRLVDTLIHPGQLNWRVILVTLLTVAVVLLVERTRAKNFGFLVALIVAAGVVAIAGWDIPTVRTLSEIPGSLPRFHVPSPKLMIDLIVPAVSIAAIGLIQAAGVSKTVPNRDGRYPDLNRDFLGQGIGNAASGVFGGMPVGGSLANTSLVVQLGGRRRIVNFIVGPIIAIVVLLLSNAVEMIPLATLGALLVVVGVRAVNIARIRTVWQTSLPARVIMGITFGAMLIMPVQYAVLLGVALSFVQYIYSSSLDVRVVALTPQPGGGLVEEQVPKTLTDASITVLDIYGSVFYAGADAIAKMLPDPVDAKRPVVILRLRGRTDVGSTFLVLLDRYRLRLAAAGGRLMLAGVGPELHKQLERTGALNSIGQENVFIAKPELAASIDEAVRSAEDWLWRPSGPA